MSGSLGKLEMLQLASVSAALSSSPKLSQVSPASYRKDCNLIGDYYG